MNNPKLALAATALAVEGLVDAAVDSFPGHHRHHGRGENRMLENLGEQITDAVIKGAGIDMAMVRQTMKDVGLG